MLTSISLRAKYLVGCCSIDGLRWFDPLLEASVTLLSPGCCCDAEFRLDRECWEDADSRFRTASRLLILETLAVLPCPITSTISYMVSKLWCIEKTNRYWKCSDDNSDVWALSFPQAEPILLSFSSFWYWFLTHFVDSTIKIPIRCATVVASESPMENCDRMWIAFALSCTVFMRSWRWVKPTMRVVSCRRILNFTPRFIDVF